MTRQTSPPRRETSVDYEEVIDAVVERVEHDAPIQPDQEWANALTHWLAALAGLGGAWAIILRTSGLSIGTTLSCLTFVFSAVAVFVASAMSHTFLDDPARLKRLRAWDQGLIYAMISGTYTPLVYQFASPSMRTFVIVAIWVAAAIGFYSKVFAAHRINSIGTLTYLLLGWLPAMFLVGRVPFIVLCWMTAGGVIYTLGVVVLLNDSRMRYLHAVWHLLVISAAGCHFWAIYRYVVDAAVITT